MPRSAQRAVDVPPPPGFPPGFGRGVRERDAVLVLASLRGIEPRRLHELAWERGTAAASLAAIQDGEAGSDNDRAFASEADPVAIATRTEELGARFVVPGDGEYLPSLFDLQADPPIGLWVRGGSLLDLTQAVSVVGARNCSKLGNEMAHAIGAGLGSAGMCVVSGAARGIDAAGHRGALAVGGTSIAVLASGLDTPYPKGSAQLLARIEASGAVISEYAPGVEAEPFRFPARNRLVATLGQALVVVEGAAHSGSMISVDHALDLGRDVYAVPGAVTSPLAEVPLALIREGATMIRGVDDLLNDLGFEAMPPDATPSDLDDRERRAWEALVEPSPPDLLARRSGLEPHEAVAALVTLELRRLVRSVGGRYERRLVVHRAADHDGEASG
jgi:DNA processing protein